MRDFGRFENDFWDASWHLFAARPVLTYDIYIEFLYKKKKKAKRNLLSKLGIWDMLDGISEACSMIVFFLYIYLEFDMNKYLKNWGNYEVLQMKLGDLLLLLLLFIYWRFMGSCVVLRWFCMRIWIFTVLTVSYLQ